jgi:hypothetical protein
MNRRVVTSLLALIVCATDLSGQRAAVPGYRARILGVYDDATGAPLDSVRVTELLHGNSSLTTETGTVALYFLPDGGGLVRLQKIGYEVQTFAVAISPADTTPMTITMRRVIELGPVISKAHQNPQYLSPALRGFEERRQAHAGGYFVSDSVLRLNEGRPLANVLASRMPNIKFAQGMASAMFLLKSARCVGGGPPQVFLDGVPLTPDLRPDAPGFRNYNGPQRTVFGQPIAGTEDSKNVDDIEFDLSKFDVSSLAGVEWYPDSDVMPIEFSHSSRRCGALMIWTRER